MEKGAFILLILVFLCFSCKPQKAYTIDMKLELKRMYVEDQKLQNYDLKKVMRKEYSDSMETELNLTCLKNTMIVKKYFKENGFPGIKENGNEIALWFWLIVQHSDSDVNFQKAVLKSMKNELTNKNVSSRHYAYLFDRIKKNERKSQLYGTQMIWDAEGVHSPYKLKSYKTVNKRRKVMGLEPIEDYIKLFNNH
jgi:hypothetical protein